MNLKETFRGYLRDAANAFDRAPAEVALAVLSAVLLSYAIEGSYRFEAWVQMAVGIFIVFACAWTGTLLHAMNAIGARTRWALTIAATVLAVAYLLLVDDVTIASEGWRAFMLVAGFALLAFAAPAWVRSPAEPNLRLRRIYGRFALRAIGIGLYGAALFGGLALALAAIDNLFELKLREQIYAHVFGWIMLVLVPWVVAGGLDSYVAPLDRISDIERVVHRLTSFLVPPLIVLYYGILFVYVVRIIATGEMPKNLVSPMVLAAGLLTALAAILFDPQPSEERAAPRTLRIAPVLFLPLVPLGFWALFTRINDYGWTEFRLLRVVALALLLVLAVFATLQLLRRRPFTLRVIPALLGAALLLAAVGPWSVLAAARRDQQARLADALRAANVDLRVMPAPRRVVDRALYERINNTAMYLQSHFGADALPAISDGYNLAERLGLQPATNDTMPTSMFGTIPSNAPVAAAAGTIYRVTESNVVVTQRDSVATIRVRGDLQANVARVLAQMGGGWQRREMRNLPALALPVFDSAGAVRGELVILEAVVERRRDATKLNRLDAILILR